MYLCHHNYPLSIIHYTKVSLTEFYSDAPVLATIATLAYAVIVGMFIYMLIRMYKK